VTAYALAFGGLMLLGGRLADLMGARTTFLVGLTAFSAASLVSGLAPNAAWLIAGRVGQGTGAALLSPSALALVSTMFHGPERNRALGIWAAVGGTGSAVGVLVGGLLTSGPGWEWIFFVNVPVGAVVFAAVPLLVARTPRAGTSARLDLPGAALATGGTALLILGITRAADHGWTSTGVLLSLGGAVLAYLAFAAVERASAEPLVPLAMFTRRPVVTGALGMLIGTGLLVSCFFLGSLYLQQNVGLSALRTGLVFLPVAVAVTLGAGIGSHLLGKLGPRLVAAGGLAIAAIGMALLTGLPVDGGVADVLPGLLLATAGVGPVLVSSTTVALAHARPEQAGLTSGLVNTFHELGAALGVALVSSAAALSLAPGAATADGFTRTFLGAAVVAGAAALAVVLLVPGGKLPVGDGPRHVH
jgi:EmrB/QacA subfamily drug resistance transporter